MNRQVYCCEVWPMKVGTEYVTKLRWQPARGKELARYRKETAQAA